MIEVVGLSKRYGNKYAVKDISFTVKKGEILGLLGQNGAGKSTTMNILTGYLSATEGSVKIGGYDILDEPIKAKKLIGYLPEIPPLYTEMTVWEYLSFMYDLKKVKLAKKGHISSVCERVNISDKSNSLIKNLSKGYRQRVGLAQAMLGDPDVLILDEPTVGLDPQQILDIRTLIQSLGEKHTVIVSSHILSEIQAVCKRVIVMREGNIIADGSPDQLSDKQNTDENVHVRVKGIEDVIAQRIKEIPTVDKVTRYGQVEPGSYDFVVEPQQGQDVREEIFVRMASSRFVILSMTTQKMSLEEVFLKLTSSDDKINSEEKSDNKQQKLEIIIDESVFSNEDEEE